MKRRVNVPAALRTPVLAVLTACLPLAGASGVDLFKGKCVMCHGADGSGNTAMGKKLELKDLRTAATQSQTDAQLTAVIENGKGKMPGQKGRLNKDEMKQLVTYLRELGKKR